MIRTAPKVNTRRVSLDAMRPEDFDRFAAMWSDPDCVCQNGERPRDRNAAWELFLRNSGHWQMTGLGQWAITELKSRQIVGSTGFHYGPAEFGEDFDPHPQVTWLVTRSAQSSGFGWEAIEAAHDWHDRVAPGPLVARLRPDDSAAALMLERMGYRVLRQVHTQSRASVLYLRSRAPGRG